jgi:hypothetical protein
MIARVVNVGKKLRSKETATVLGGDEIVEYVTLQLNQDDSPYFGGRVFTDLTVKPEFLGAGLKLEDIKIGDEYQVFFERKK